MAGRCQHYCVTCGEPADPEGLICGDCGDEHSAQAEQDRINAERYEKLKVYFLKYRGMPLGFENFDEAVDALPTNCTI